MTLHTCTLSCGLMENSDAVELTTELALVADCTRETWKWEEVVDRSKHMIEVLGLIRVKRCMSEVSVLI